MIHASCTIIACNDGRNVFGCIGSVTIHQTIISIKVAISICSDNRLIGIRNLFVTGGSQISIELHRILCMRNEGRSRLVCQYITIGFNHTTIMIVSKAISSVCSLLGNQHGILAVTEIIALYKDICPFHCTHANLRHTVIIIVPDMNTH